MPSCASASLLKSVAATCINPRSEPGRKLILSFNTGTETVDVGSPLASSLLVPAAVGNPLLDVENI